MHKPNGGSGPNWRPIRKRYDTEYTSHAASTPNQVLERLTRDENRAGKSTTTIEKTPKEAEMLKTVV